MAGKSPDLNPTEILYVSEWTKITPDWETGDVLLWLQMCESFKARASTRPNNFWQH